MPDAVPMMLAFAAGSGLGAFYFAGLWWTLRHCLGSTRPALLLVGSLIVRTGVVLAGFYWVSGHTWQRLLASGLGFAIARLVVTWLALRPEAAIAEEGAHAP